MQIELYSKLQDPLDAIERLGIMLSKSGMAKCDRVEQGQVLAWACVSERKSPFQILRTFHLVDGQLSKKAMAALAEFRQLGGKHKWLKTGEDGLEAQGEFTYEGNSLTVSFTLEDAKRQNLVKPNSTWIKNPGVMLRARVSSAAVAMLAPEIYAGDDDGGGNDIPDAPALDLDVICPDATPPAAKPNPVLDVEAEIVPDDAPAPHKPIPAVPLPTPAASKAKPPVNPTPPKPTQPTFTPPQPDAPPPQLDLGPPSLPPPFRPAANPPVPVAPPPAAPIAAPPPEPIILVSPEQVEAMGQIFAGNFLRVATWMIREKWIPGCFTPMITEAAAGAHLQAHLPALSQIRAQRILTRKMNFMRSVTEIPRQ